MKFMTHLDVINSLINGKGIINRKRKPSYRSKLPSELRLPFFFLCMGEAEPIEPCGEWVSFSLLLLDMRKFLPSFPSVLRGETPFMRSRVPLMEPPFPDPPRRTSLASFSSSSSSNGFLSRGTRPSRSEPPLLLGQSSSDPGSLNELRLRLIFLRMNSLCVVDKSTLNLPPFSRDGRFLRTGMVVVGGYMLEVR